MLQARRFGLRTPVGKDTLMLFTFMQTGPGASSKYCKMSTESFAGVKRQRRGVDHPSPPTDEVKNEWRHTTSILPPLSLYGILQHDLYLYTNSYSNNFYGSSFLTYFLSFFLSFFLASFYLPIVVVQGCFCTCPYSMAHTHTHRSFLTYFLSFFLSFFLASFYLPIVVVQGCFCTCPYSMAHTHTHLEGSAVAEIPT